MRFCLPQIRRLGIEAPADRRVAAPVVGMAVGAMIREVQPRTAKIFRHGGNGIVRVARARRDRHAPRVARNHCFEMRGRSPGAQAIVEKARGKCGRETRDGEQDYRDERSAFHGAEIDPAK